MKKISGKQKGLNKREKQTGKIRKLQREKLDHRKPVKEEKDER